jgi:hypothetical protein
MEIKILLKSVSPNVSQVIHVFKFKFSVLKVILLLNFVGMTKFTKHILDMIIVLTKCNYASITYSQSCIRTSKPLNSGLWPQEHMSGPNFLKVLHAPVVP